MIIHCFVNPVLGPASRSTVGGFDDWRNALCTLHVKTFTPSPHLIERTNNLVNSLDSARQKTNFFPLLSLSLSLQQKAIQSLDSRDLTAAESLSLESRLSDFDLLLLNRRCNTKKRLTDETEPEGESRFFIEELTMDLGLNCVVVRTARWKKKTALCLHCLYKTDHLNVVNPLSPKVLHELVRWPAIPIGTIGKCTSRYCDWSVIFFLSSIRLYAVSIATGQLNPVYVWNLPPWTRYQPRTKPITSLPALTWMIIDRFTRAIPRPNLHIIPISIRSQILEPMGP